MDIGLILAVADTQPTTLETIGSYLWMILGVGAGLTFVIFVHELGHFLVAKACGVKCEKFYVGFDFFEIPIPFTPWKIPRSLIKFQWGETEYGLGSLPLGGYVKMLGQDDDPRNAEAEAARIRAAAPADTDKARADAIQSGAAAEGLVSGQTVETGTQAALSTDPAEAVPAKTTDGGTVLLDPRSYPAKPIPARMAIISAGVIMNLIFAVILAGVAYRMGVEEVPAIVGGTTPGGAAWLRGIEPGSKVIQVGKSGQPYESLRWDDFRAAAVLNNGRDVSLLVRRPDGQEVWYEVRPSTNPRTKMPMIGLARPLNAEINVFPESLAHLNPKSSQTLKDHDRVIEAAGQKIGSGSDLTAIFAQQPTGPLPLKVERRERTKEGKLVENSKETPQVLEMTLEPRPMRELGVAVKIGPIVAVQEGSPAFDAGLREGDQIVSINGQPIGDPLSLSQRLTPRPGTVEPGTRESGTVEPITIEVQRKDRQGQLVGREFRIVPQAPLQSPTHVPTETVSIEPLGVAFKLTNEVAEVAEGGPAAQAGLEAGDILTKLEFLPSADPRRDEALTRITRFDLSEAVELKPDKDSWADVASQLQLVFPDTKVRLTWLRGAETKSAEMLPRPSETFFHDTRGVVQYLHQEMHTASDWGDAFRLGFREAVEQVKQVITILHSLVTGRVSATNLSGPAGIIVAAGSFASEGLPSLLIFLTILSANLAVLNFLPIPALDGGHMLFLTAEWIRGKPVDEKLQIRLTIVGVVCLLSLMVFATAMDIGRFAELIQKWFS